MNSSHLARWACAGLSFLPLLGEMRAWRRGVRARLSPKKRVSRPRRGSRLTVASQYEGLTRVEAREPRNRFAGFGTSGLRCEGALARATTFPSGQRRVSSALVDDVGRDGESLLWCKRLSFDPRSVDRREHRACPVAADPDGEVLLSCRPGRGRT